MEELTQTILSLPLTGLIPVVLLLLVGLVLWLAGRRVLRTGFAAAGLVLGGVLGWAAGGLDVVGAMNVPAWVFAAVAAVVAALVFAAAYRVVLAAVIALLLGALAPLSVWTAAELGVLPGRSAGPVAQEPLYAGTLPQSDAEPATDLDRWLEEVFGNPASPAELDVAQPDPASGDEGGAVAGSWRDWWEAAAKTLRKLADTAWAKSAGPLRPSLFAAAAVGGLLGLVLGAAAPAFSAAVVTALGGSIVMLTSGWTLAARADVPQGPWMPTTPTQLLVWWLGLTVIGLGIQWMLQAKHADKAAS